MDWIPNLFIPTKSVSGFEACLFLDSGCASALLVQRNFKGKPRLVIVAAVEQLQLIFPLIP